MPTNDAFYIYGDVRLLPTANGNSAFYFYEDAERAGPGSSGSTAFYFFENAGISIEASREAAFYIYEHVAIPITGGGPEPLVTASIEAASLQGVAVRFTQLDAVGRLTSNVVTTSGFVLLQFTPQYSDSNEIVVRNGEGVPVGSVEVPGTLESIAVTLDVCGIDGLLAKLLSSGDTLQVDPQLPDYAAVAFDEDASGVAAVEVWTRALGDDAVTALGVKPYFRWVLPYVELQFSGDRTIQEDVIATELTGVGWGNPYFGAGPAADWTFSSSRPYQYARDASYPGGA